MYKIQRKDLLTGILTVSKKSYLLNVAEALKREYASQDYQGEYSLVEA